MRLFICIYLICFFQSGGLLSQITRGDTIIKNIALVFTGNEFGDGGNFILEALNNANVRASFFLTGNFYRNPAFNQLIKNFISDGHYMGSHSDKHLLYCDWENRDSLLVTHNEFKADLDNSYHELKKWGISKNNARFFLPPYEWYNDSIVEWTKRYGLQLINFTPGTRSTADYTYPGMGSRYVDSRSILKSIYDFEKTSPAGLNGFILLVHIGTDPRRTDKFYYLLPGLLSNLKSQGYNWLRIDELLIKQ